MRYTRWLAVSLLAAYLPACTSYHVLADPAVALQPAPDMPGQIRVTTTDGRKILVKMPTIYGDSLRGMSELTQPMSLAVADISTVEVPKPSLSKSIGLGLGIAVGVGVIVGAAVVSSSSLGGW